MAQTTVRGNGTLYGQRFALAMSTLRSRGITGDEARETAYNEAVDAGKQDLRRLSPGRTFDLEMGDDGGVEFRAHVLDTLLSEDPERFPVESFDCIRPAVDIRGKETPKEGWPVHMPARRVDIHLGIQEFEPAQVGPLARRIATIVETGLMDSTTQRITIDAERSGEPGRMVAAGAANIASRGQRRPANRKLICLT